MSHKMFRYLSKNYLGKYRVKTHAMDLDTGDFPRLETGEIDPEIDDEYIKCTKGEIRASYRQTRGIDVLCWYTESGQTGRNVYAEVKEKYPDIWLEPDDNGSCDFLLYFDAQDIEKIAKIVKPNTAGASIRPYSTKNIVPEEKYVIPDDDLKKYNDITEDMEDRLIKMQFGKSVIADYITMIDKAYPKKNYAQAFKNTILKSKEFIHSIGKWDDFIKYSKDYKVKYLQEK